MWGLWVKLTTEIPVRIKIKDSRHLKLSNVTADDILHF